MKPEITEVLRYAKPLIYKFISKYAKDCPREQKEEIEQQAYERLLEKYAEIDADAGWRSYVYNHCRGAVLDYLKFGSGFAEEKWSILKEEAHGSKHVNKIRERLFLENQDGGGLDLDFVLGSNGAFSEIDLDAPSINWKILSRLASTDKCLHVFLKWLRGFSLDEIGPILGLSRSRAGQLFTAFLDRFDDPFFADDPWFRQTLWALGLARRFGIPDMDQREVLSGVGQLGWNLEPVDLDLDCPKTYLAARQFDFFEGLDGEKPRLRKKTSWSHL